MRNVLAALITVMATAGSGCAFETPDDGTMEDVESEPVDELVPEEEWATSDSETSDTEQMKAATPQCTRSAPATRGRP